MYSSTKINNKSTDDPVRVGEFPIDETITSKYEWSMIGLRQCEIGIH